MRMKINVGMIGYGFMGKAHTYAYKAIPVYYPASGLEICLKAVCAGHISNAQKAAKEQGYLYATDDFDKIINDSDINVINICTPNSLHESIALKALKAGKHVYCDKPVAATAAGALRLAEAARAARGYSQCTFQNRFFPATLRLKQLADEGRLGNILSFRGVYLHSGSVDASRPMSWRYGPVSEGGGTLLDLGSHIIDLISWIAGPLTVIDCATKTHVTKRKDKSGQFKDVTSDDMAVLIAKAGPGALGTIEASKLATGATDKLRLEIEGEKGAAAFDLRKPNILEFYDNTQPLGEYGGMRGFTRIDCMQHYPGCDFLSGTNAIGWVRAHVESLYRFLCCIRDGIRPSPSFDEAAYVMQVIEQARNCEKRI